jgi:two-component system osmolarity sensor histidine kinase EnvZ
VPRGIYARAALILIVPVLAVQLVVSSVFIQRHYENVTEQMALALSLDLNLILDTYARDGAEAAGMAVADALEIGHRAAARPDGRPAAVLRPVGHGDDGYLL